MRLSDLAAGAPPVPLSNIGAFKDLAVELQNLMGGLGVLDPPADGAFGPASRWALAETLGALGLAAKPAIDPEVAAKLLGADPRTLFALNAGNDFAGRIVPHGDPGYWLCRHPACEHHLCRGCNLDGTLTDNAPNVQRRAAGAARRPAHRRRRSSGMAGDDGAGRYYRNPWTNGGLDRAAAVQSGASASTAPATMPGAGQVADITVYRDKNKDSSPGDLLHRLFGVGSTGATICPRRHPECQRRLPVGRLKQGHVEFMKTQGRTAGQNIGPSLHDDNHCRQRALAPAVSPV